jgi:hypothetical protein
MPETGTTVARLWEDVAAEQIAYSGKSPEEMRRDIYRVLRWVANLPNAEDLVAARKLLSQPRYRETLARLRDTA